MELITLPVDKFVATTASGEPVPGGGSISALTGSLSAALAAMVSRLTIGKKKYADVQSRMEELAEKLSQASTLMLKAVDLDSNAYDLVFQAYKMPKDTDEQKEARSFAIQQALKHAAAVPMSVATMVNTFLPDLIEVATYGNQNAITDAYVATLCARTAILGAGANVRINLTSIADEQFVKETTRDLIEIERAAYDTEDKVKTLLDKALQ